MRHLVLVLAIGCGGGTSGEPLMGTVTLTYGDDKPKMVVGAAVQSRAVPGSMLVQIGSDNVDCESYLDDFGTRPPKGSFVFFTVNKSMLTSSVEIAVLHSTSNSLSLNETAGSVTITTIEPRVTGMVTFATTDEEVGMITVAGTFDVVRCF